MPPKASTTSDKPESEVRRSARVASKPPSSKAEQPAAAVKPASSKKPASSSAAAKKPESKAKPASTKRAAPADDDKAAAAAKPASKKAKPASTKGAAEGGAPKSTSKPKSASKPKSSAGAAAANGDAKKDAGAAKEQEKQAEAPAAAEPATGGKKELEEGDSIPSITLKDNTDTDVDISTLTQSRGVIFFTYPKANTPGCTNQACGYRDVYDEIQQAGYDVYGLSRDGPSAQDKWAKSKNFQYKLLCDPKSEFIKRLGAFVAPANTKRSHFIFAKGGKLIEKKLGVSPKDDPTNALEFIKSYKA